MVGVGAALGYVYNDLVGFSPQPFLFPSCTAFIFKEPDHVLP